MAWKRYAGILALALVAICGGFLTLTGNHLSLGPLLLVGGYCVLLPAYLWLTFNNAGTAGIEGHGGE